MDWKLAHLLTFASVAEAGGFTRAAEALGVSQPAVSKQIAELEAALGVVLVERIRRNIRISEAGEVLLLYARRLRATLDEAATAMADLTALRRGRLRIGATPTIGTYLLPQALVYFRERFPSVEVTADVRSAGLLLDAMNDGNLDLVLAPHQPKVKPSRTFLNDPIAAVVAPNHPLSKRRQITLGELEQVKLILRHARGQSAGYVERMLRVRRCRPTSVLRLPQTEAVRQAALAGLGIGFLPGIAVRDAIAEGRLVQLSIRQFTLRRNYVWLERPTAPQSKAVRAFECVLKHAVRGTLPAAPRASVG